MSPSAVVFLFAKFPKTGFVKTRLSDPKVSENPLSPELARTLYESILHDVLPRLIDPAWKLIVKLGGASKEELKSFQTQFDLEEGQVVPMERSTNDLGQLMELTLAQGKTSGFLKTIIVGSDSPQLGKTQLYASLRALNTSQMVIGPDNGGGMYLVGVQEPMGLMNSGIQWSCGKDRQQLLDKCRINKVSTTMIEPLIDLDNTRDISEWQSAIETMDDEEKRSTYPYLSKLMSKGF